MEKLHVVPCEQVLFWCIIYDGGGPEVVIDKITGQVVKIYEIPQGLVDDADAIEPAASGISEQEAIEIAKRNFRAWCGREHRRARRVGIRTESPCVVWERG